MVRRDRQTWLARICWFCFVLLCVNTTASAQGIEQTAELTERYKTADTSSPRATLRSFIDGCNAIYEIIEKERFFDRRKPRHAHLAARILDCLDTSELPAFAREQQSTEVALAIKEILDREELPDWSEIPDTEQIDEAGGVEKLSHYRIPGTRITIAWIDDGPRRHEYLFSIGTVERAVGYFERIRGKEMRTSGPGVTPGFYDYFMSAPGNASLAFFVDRLPRSLRLGSAFGMTGWKWIGIGIAFTFATLIIATLYRIQHVLVMKYRGKSNLGYLLTLVFPLTAVMVPGWTRHCCEWYLSIRGQPLYIIGFLCNLCSLAISVFVVFGISRRIVAIIISSPSINAKGINAQLIRITAQLLAATTAVTLFMVWGQYLGIPIATLLASAGIGGIALALGAQDTLKTLFGTLMLMIDRPFRVGERIMFAGYDGIVEDISLRSTKVRLLTGNLATLPNDQVANADIENVAKRKCIRRSTDLHLPLDTPFKKIESTVEAIRDLLKDHEGMSPETPPRVYFDEFVDEGFRIKMMYWYTPPEYWDYMRFSQEINLKILAVLDREQVQLSKAMRHKYEGGGPPDVLTPTEDPTTQLPTD